MSTDWKPQVGMKVTASPFGSAVITRIAHSGIIVQLTELSGLEIELLQDQLQPVNDPLSMSARSIQESDVEEIPYRAQSREQEHSLLSDGADFRRSIDALRFGLVPDKALEALTVGIEELSDWSSRRFPEAHAGHPLASAVTGPFGTGKSHTMAVIRRLALRSGYVVARVEVDGRAVSLSAPAKLLHQLWTTTQLGDDRSATPLFDLYLRAVNKGRPAPSIAPRGIDRIQHNYEVVAAIRKAGHVDKHGTLLEALLSSSDEVVTSEVSRALRLERNPAYWNARPKPMIGSRVEDRPYDFVEVLAGHAVVAQLGGFKGLIVTVDEFEVERVLTRLQYQRVSDLLQILTDYFNDKLDYTGAPLGMFFATVGDDDHEGDEAISAMVGNSRDAHYYLESWSCEQRSELAERIYGVYCAAYGITSGYDSALADNVECQLSFYGDGDSGLVRAFIKSYVALLDVVFGPPFSA
jgi:hypothetical protein